MNRSERVAKRPVRPVHPGEILREDVLPALGLSQAAFAEALGVSRRTVNEILQGKRPVSPEMAHRLGRALGNGPELWLNLQATVDMWDALHIDSSRFKGVRQLKAA